MEEKKDGKGATSLHTCLLDLKWC